MVTANTERNRRISAVPTTEFEMLESGLKTDEKTKLFDGENNLKVSLISINANKPENIRQNIIVQVTTDNPQNGNTHSGKTIRFSRC